MISSCIQQPSLICITILILLLKKMDFPFYKTNSTNGLFHIMDNYWLWDMLTITFPLFILPNSPYFFSFREGDHIARRIMHRDLWHLQHFVFLLFVCFCFVSLSMSMLCYALFYLWYLIVFFVFFLVCSLGLVWFVA